ncbi:MAG TPA: BrnT family toxin [Vicinamibacterales bacterium]|nr:BrnT family toxin [Vicinamibacterales bacterium]
MPELRYTFYTMELEFDARKSRSNQRKHGIDFIKAQQLWDDPNLIAVPARTTDEPRILIVGRIEELHWSAIISYRGNHVRIISVRRSRREEVNSMKAKAKELDRRFDAGEDITTYLDLSRARRPGHEQRRVNVDFPVWMIESLDREASRLGVPRQSLIKMLIARHLEELGSSAPSP